MLKTFVEKSKRKPEEQKDYFTAKDDSIPRLSWDKYYNEGNKLLLPFSIQAHYSFVDGIRMGQYVEYLQRYLSSFE
ncbi:CatA-like O-acetyltransferase [Clostridium sp. A1-XYC3]|uniref:CatA-like O-acetyltransferase n=1 Tax=Clostridium tanneri TaxID=3037988 RepID=A0ABU4JXF1_9CLOT|nr:CatA-like O-acetyltransferase [Clostridium sp. A1-XYC3]MDW8802837.1 CatA-like O-acetyltransferase [Clostridium sp. A1-XYC3]